jgi:hypothetical protein
VRGYDGEQYGNWTTDWTINISSYISTSMPVNLVAFGSIDYLSYNDTTDDSPSAFKLQNDGNALVNVTVSASNLWTSIVNPNNYYRFKARNVTGKGSNFRWASSLTTWQQMPASPLLSIVELNDSDVSDDVDVDLYVEVPPNEAPSNRNSTVYFVSSLAE